MSNEKSLNLDRDKLFLGKKIRFSNETIIKVENKKNKGKTNNNTTYLNRPITFSKYFIKKLNQPDSNFNEKECIYQSFDNSEKEKNETLQNPFCFICGIKVKEKIFYYLINPFQKLGLINELKKLDLIFKRKEEKLEIEEQNFTEVRLCNKCHSTYFKILKPFLKQECKNNIKKMKDNQIEITIKKGDNLPEIYNSNYSNINKNLQLLNNNIQNNMDFQLNNSNEGINNKSVVDNKNNFLDDNENNINVINAGIINNEKMVGINRNYNTFIHSINSKTLNTKIGNNNLYSKITNLNSNDISFNLNKPSDLINNLNFVPQIPLFINNSSINNINQLNNMNIYQNLNQRIGNNFFKSNAINSMKNDDSNAFLNHLDISQILNAKNIKK